MDFTFEILSESAINIRFNYGGEWFTFNLYDRDRQWVLHPFDSMLIRNSDMCRLVIADLLQNKAFQVMLAKEGILLSELNTTVDLRPEPEQEQEEIRLPGNRGGGVSDQNADIDELIQQMSLEEFVRMEAEQIGSRIDIYRYILNKMFMEDLGPGDKEFRDVQAIVRAYESARAEMLRLIGETGEDSRRRF